MARATSCPRWGSTCEWYLEIVSSISRFDLRGIFRRWAKCNCACSACTCIARIPHAAQRSETSDRIVCQPCSRHFLPLLGQSHMVGNGGDGYRGFGRWRNWRIGGGSGSTLSATRDCGGARGGNLHRIFPLIGVAANAAACAEFEDGYNQG